LLIVALLERGEPMTLEDVALRLTEVGVVGFGRVLVGLKRCRPARAPVYRVGELYALDPHDEELSLLAFCLGLKPPRVARPVAVVAWTEAFREPEGGGLPRSGTIVPEMGRTRAGTGLADALFTKVQQRVLGLLFGQPSRRFQSGEIIRLARSGTGAVHRQLGRLAAAGLLTVTRTGNQKHYQARADSAVFDELRGLIVKTVGLAEPLREALAARADEIRAAFVYGSVAKGIDRAQSDIDLMVISDSLHYQEVFDALQNVEATLGRTVNPTVVTRRDWQKRRTTANSFAARVAAQPRLFVIGSDDGLT
jgi:predicted nucleotidyltransferase